MNSLDAERVLDYFLNASSDGFNGKISSVPPALPTEGQVFVFDLGPDKSLWENNKRKFRQVYEEIVNSDRGGPNHCVMTPRNYKQDHCAHNGSSFVGFFGTFTKSNVQLPPAKHAKYSTDDGNISPQSISGAPVSTTLYPSSYHDQFPPGTEDVLQGSPTLNASPSPRMPPAAIDDIPHASFSNENNAPSNVVIEGDSQSTYLSILCQGKSLNVNCNRQLYNSANDTGFDNISWNEYLTKINILFPDILAASYVCEATYYKEIEYLRPGCIVVLQTARSNQVAFLRRMFDDSNGGKPIVEVISTYMAPDRSELNYHAGIAVRSHGVIEVTVKHCGVQFIESEEDILLAGLVFHACYQPESDLSKLLNGTRDDLLDEVLLKMNLCSTEQRASMRRTGYCWATFCIDEHKSFRLVGQDDFRSCIYAGSSKRQDFSMVALLVCAEYNGRVDTLNG
eukprot:Em0001g2904a